MTAGGQDFTTRRPDLTHPRTPPQHVPRPDSNTRGFPSTEQVAREPGSLDSDVI
jgi:hypothetical protein